MATVTGYSAARMKAIEDSCITSGAVLLDHLMLTRHDGTVIDAGAVRGPKGDQGLQGIPGINGANGKDAAPGDVNPTANTTPIRTADGRVKTAPATQSDDAVQLSRLTDGTKDLTVARVHLTAEDDVSETSTTNGIQIGPTSGTNTVIDGNEMMTRINGVGKKTFFQYGIQTGGSPDFVPTSAGDLVTKQVVDPFIVGIELAGGEDLNLKADPGVYTQNSNAEAASGLNYPVGLAGVLEVQSNTARDYNMIWQRYTPYGTNANKFYARAWYNTTGWTRWQMYVPGDIPWTTVTSFAASVQTLVSGTYGPVRYRVVGDMCYWNGPVQTTTARSGNWTMMTVPGPAKPQYSQQMTGITGSLGGYGITAGLFFGGMVFVDPATGLMTAYSGVSGSWGANGYVFLNGSYPLT